MTRAEALAEYRDLDSICPTFCQLGHEVGELAVAGANDGKTQFFSALSPLPPEVMVQLVLLLVDLFGQLVRYCKKEDREPVLMPPEDIQEFLTERPLFSFRGRRIRRAANAKWAEKNLPDIQIGWAVDEKCQELKGTFGLKKIELALKELSLMNDAETREPVEGLRSCPPFRIVVDDGAAAVGRARQAIEAEGGTLAGGPTSGSFTGMGIVGTYQEEAGKPGSFVITITSKPIVYPCSTIENRVREFFR